MRPLKKAEVYDETSMVLLNILHQMELIKFIIILFHTSQSILL